MAASLINEETMDMPEIPEAVTAKTFEESHIFLNNKSVDDKENIKPSDLLKGLKHDTANRDFRTRTNSSKEAVAAVKVERSVETPKVQAKIKQRMDMKKQSVLAGGCILSVVLGHCCRESLEVKNSMLSMKWCSECQKRTNWAKYLPGGPFKKPAT